MKIKYVDDIDNDGPPSSFSPLSLCLHCGVEGKLFMKLIVVVLLCFVLLGNWMVYCFHDLLPSTVNLLFLGVVHIVTTNHNHDSHY
jgi:hypothetical protein